IPLCRALLPAGRTQVAQRCPALSIIEFRYLPEQKRITFARVAGKIVENPPTRRHGGGMGMRKLQLIDRPVSRKFHLRLGGRRSPAAVSRKKKNREDSRNRDRRGAGRIAEDSHENRLLAARAAQT